MEPDGGTGAVLNAIRTVAETGSTNADMLALAVDGIAEGSWLRAERQVAGRGRQGRVWTSPAGNLSASTVVWIRPTDPQAATLAMVAAVALEEAVALYIPPAVPSDAAAARGRVGADPVGGEQVSRLRLKWPNDLLLDGSKMSGILLERSGDAVVVGIGVNLAHAPELGDRVTASLAAAIGAAVLPGAFLETLAEAFARWLARWRGEGLDPVLRRWLERAHPVGTPLTARLPDGDAVDGLFDGLDAGGALLLRLAGGERRVIHAADVFLI